MEMKSYTRRLRLGKATPGQGLLMGSRGSQELLLRMESVLPKQDGAASGLWKERATSGLDEGCPRWA